MRIITRLLLVIALAGVLGCVCAHWVCGNTLDQYLLLDPPIGPMNITWPDSAYAIALPDDKDDAPLCLERGHVPVNMVRYAIDIVDYGDSTAVIWLYVPEDGTQHCKRCGCALTAEPRYAREIIWRR